MDNNIFYVVLSVSTWNYIFYCLNSLALVVVWNNPSSLVFS